MLQSAFRVLSRILSLGASCMKCCLGSGGMPSSPPPPPQKKKKKKKKIKKVWDFEMDFDAILEVNSCLIL